MVVLSLMILGLAITLAPFTIVAFILILSSAGGVRKGLALILGWTACLVAVIAAMLLITGGNPPRPKTAPSTAALVVKALLGALLIWIGFASGGAWAARASSRAGWRGWTGCRCGPPPGSACSCSRGRWWPWGRRRSCRPSCPPRATG